MAVLCSLGAWLDILLMLTAPCGHQTVCKRSLYTSVLYFGSLDYVGCNKGFSEGMCQRIMGIMWVGR